MSPLKPYGSPARRANPRRTSKAVEEPNANDPPSEHVARLPFESNHEVNDLRPHSAESRSNGRVVIGALRRDLRTCLADAQTMALDRAQEAGVQTADAVSHAQNTLSSDRRVGSNRHDTCSSNAGRNRPQQNCSAPSGTESRGRSPHTIPSTPDGAPEFRDLAGFEWRVRQPSRRDSKCVPI